MVTLEISETREEGKVQQVQWANQHAGTSVKCSTHAVSACLCLAVLTTNPEVRRAGVHEEAEISGWIPYLHGGDVAHILPSARTLSSDRVSLAAQTGDHALNVKAD